MINSTNLLRRQLVSHSNFSFKSYKINWISSTFLFIVSSEATELLFHKAARVCKYCLTFSHFWINGKGVNLKSGNFDFNMEANKIRFRFSLWCVTGKHVPSIFVIKVRQFSRPGSGRLPARIEDCRDYATEVLMNIPCCNQTCRFARIPIQSASCGKPEWNWKGRSLPAGQTNPL